MCMTEESIGTAEGFAALTCVSCNGNLYSEHCQCSATQIFGKTQLWSFWITQAIADSLNNIAVL